MAGPSVATGLALAWTRAISEFGATLMFAGNLTGRTQTMPLAIMTSMESSLSTALALSGHSHVNVRTPTPAQWAEELIGPRLQAAGWRRLAPDADLLLLEQIAAQVPGMLFQFHWRADGPACFPYVSEGVEQIYGLSPAQLASSFAPIVGRVHGPDRSALLPSIRPAARELTPWHS